MQDLRLPKGRSTIGSLISSEAVYSKCLFLATLGDNITSKRGLTVLILLLTHHAAHHSLRYPVQSWQDMESQPYPCEVSELYSVLCYWNSFCTVGWACPIKTSFTKPAGFNTLKLSPQQSHSAQNLPCSTPSRTHLFTPFPSSQTQTISLKTESPQLSLIRSRLPDILTRSTHLNALWSQWEHWPSKALCLSISWTASFGHHLNCVRGRWRSLSQTRAKRTCLVIFS